MESLAWYDHGFRFLVSGHFIIMYCSGIILFACENIRRLGHGAGTLRKDLRQLRMMLTPPEGRSFAEHFDREYNEMASELLGVAWTEFVETLAERKPGQPVQNVVDATLYLNRETIIDGRIASRWVKTVPNLLTGLGILGTFMGLAAGVRLASEGLGSPNANDALRGLLDGASLAFVTSIVGMLSSMVFLGVERTKSQKLQNALREWVNALDHRLQRVDSSEVAVMGIANQISGLALQVTTINNSLGQLASQDVATKQLEQAEQTTNQLKRFNDELIWSLEAALEDKIGNRLGPSLEKLVAAMEGLRTDQSHESKWMVQEVLQDFTDALHQRAGSEMDEMVAALSELKDTLQESTHQMESGQEKLSSAFADQLGAISDALDSNTAAMTASLRTSLEQVTVTMAEVSQQVALQFQRSGNAAIEHVRSTVETSTQALAAAASEAAAHISASWKQLSLSAERLEQSVKQSGQMLDAMEGFVDGLNAMHATIQTTLESIAEVARPMEQAANDMRSSSDGTRDAMTKVKVVVSDLAVHEREIASAWSRYQERFEGLDESLRRVFSQLQDGLETYLREVARFVIVLDDKTASSITLLAGATDELGERIEELGDAMEEWKDR